MTTYAESLNRSLDEIMGLYPQVYLVGEDIKDPYGGAFKVTKGLSTRYPGRVISTPISEAGITGVATGMAIRGLRPVLEIMFGDFLSLAVDQILSNISKLRWMYNSQISLPLVIRSPMGGRRGYGPTHSQCLEKLFLGMPCLKIVAPSYFHNPGELLKKSVIDEEPVIFIEYKLDYPRRLKEIKAGKSQEWFVRFSRQGYKTLFLSATDFSDDEVTLITYGGMLPIVEETAKRMLYEDDVSSEIIIPSLIKPINPEEFITSVKKTGRVVIIEEGTKTAGWGAEVAALLSEAAFSYLKAPIKRVAALDLPIGCASTLEEAILPTGDDIAAAIKEIL